MEFLQLLVGAVLQGGLYSLMALGLTLTLGVMGVVDMSYGVYYALGAYFCTFLVLSVDLPFFLAAPAALVIVFLVGTVVHYAIINRVRSDALACIIATFAFAYAVEETIRATFGPLFRSMPPYARGSFHVWQELALEKQRAFSFVVAVIGITMLLVFLKKAKFGRALRMVAQQRAGAYLVGVNVGRVELMTFAIGTVLAAAAGILLSPMFLVFPSMGWSPLLKAFGIVILGGMGSVKGTIVAAFIMALVEVFSTYYIHQSLAQISYFLVLIVAILVRPSGLFGTKEVI